MRVLPCVFVLLAALAAAGGAAAQSLLDLTGRYRCVHLCRDGVVGDPAFITQNGREMNLLNEVGEPSRGWIEGNGRIWAQAWNEGAVFSPDGAIIQFDRGTIWQRELGEGVEPPALRGRRQIARRVAPAAPVAPVAPPERAAASPRAYDGSWSVVISTRNGGCDPEYRFGIEIVDGNVRYGGGAGVDVQGNVGPNGGVRVSVSSGGQRADGQGRLSRNVGAGTWTGQGPAGVCAGVWQAARHG
jgi:hypothetical protein